MTTLTGVSATLLLPLLARARETHRPDGLVRDPLAQTLLERFAPDYAPPPRFGPIQLEIALRTAVLDAAVADFLARHADALVVNLGAGLCTRFCRLDDGRVRWIDVDLPAVGALWQQAFAPSPRRRFLAASVLDAAWLDAVRREPGPKLFIAEGLLMYLAPADVRTLLTRLASACPGAELLLEVWSPAATRRLNAHPALAALGVRFGWALEHGAAIERCADGLVLLAERPLFDPRCRRLGPWRALAWLPAFRRLAKILHLRCRAPA